MSEPKFAPGDVVQLRSGGPLMTVSVAFCNTVEVVYHNIVSGIFEKIDINQDCLRSANQAPQIPEDARTMRHNTVARSTL